MTNTALERHRNKPANREDGGVADVGASEDEVIQ
jgi:hypothetical protein